MSMKFVNKSDTEAEIYISGDIVDDDLGGWLSSWDEQGFDYPANIKAQLSELKGKDITIYINSDGGSVPAGVAMANMIARHDGHTKAVVDGWCCSIATQIFFAADEREMPENAYLMVHKPWVATSGDANDMRKSAEMLDTLQEGLESTYRKAARDGITAEDIHAMVEAETWLTGREASEMFNISLLGESKAYAMRGKDFKASSKMPKGIVFVDSGEPLPPIPPMPLPQPPAEPVNNYQKEKVEIALALAKGAMLI